MLENSLDILKKYYGYEKFRKGQEKIISSILEGQDTFAIMPTGAGKSICYQIPAMLLDGITLIISPLISLMKDQVDTLIDMGIPATYINSSLGITEVNKRVLDIKQGKYKLLYIAPERLESFDFTQLIISLKISFVAIDEAHCVSQWGHDFRPSYRSIPSFIRQLAKRPIISAFTATATEEVKDDIVSLLNLKNPNIYISGFNRENLFFSVVKGENKRDYVIEYVRNNKEQVGIIYAATRKEVENIYKDLIRAGFSVTKYHAGLTINERKKNQENFLFDNNNIIVATNAFGMGIDKSNVRYVIHYNLPKNMEAYYQEAGRAGRDGLPSECILLFGPQDILIQKFMIEQSVSAPERRKTDYNKLQEMVDYCYTPHCLRNYILNYFGEENSSKNCGNCSTCTDDSELVDITLEAKKIYSCVVRTKERFGTTIIAQVLKGSENKKIIELGLNKISTYGIMSEYTEKEIKDMINILVADNYLALTEGQYPVIKLKEKAVAVLKSDKKVFQKIRKKKEIISKDNGLFELLKKLRKDISIKENLPPYIIFPDSTLREMSIQCPTDNISLLNIKGVGEKKAELYGEIFIKKIKKYVNENLTKVNKSVLSISTINNLPSKTPSYLLTYELYNKGLSLEEIAKHRKISIITIQNHIIQAASEGFAIDLDAYIPKQYESLILETIQEIGKEKLKPIKDKLPDEIDYLAIKAVITKHSHK